MENSFKKDERLCLKSRFELLLKKGNSFFIYPFRVIYLENSFEIGKYPAQVAFAVRKRQFKRAVQRNLIKRRCKEAYRLNKQPLYDFLAGENRTMILLLVYSADQVLTFKEISRKMQAVLERLTGLSENKMQHETLTN